MAKGRIQGVARGKDGKVRVVVVKTSRDKPWHGLTLKALKRKNLILGVFCDGQSESDIRYEKLSQLCRIMPDDSILETPCSRSLP
ncbi:hypothetical protein TNCV_4051901 [Trichonephila clavipes]|nr:hypothetical protein TNCV_4051901 [Trichonephila clavipes]